MSVTVSAPGKIFLMGEHAVVYGKPALLSCINKRVYVTIENSRGEISIDSEDNQFILSIIGLVKKHYNLKILAPFKIKVNSEIKKGYHLGSSASVSVAVIAALIYYLKKIWHPQIVNKLSFEAEKLKHGNPSGADNSCVTFGGFVWFRKELEFLKSIWQVSLAVNPSLNHFYLIDTGRPVESTKTMVSLVAKNYQIRTKEMDSLFAQNEMETKNIARALKDENKRLLLDSIKKGESVLEKIGVVGNYVLPLIRDIENSGGAAKILGGGGKKGSVGYLLCFHENKNKLNNVVKKYNFTLEQITLGEEGLRLESGKIK